MLVLECIFVGIQRHSNCSNVGLNKRRRRPNYKARLSSYLPQRRSILGCTLASRKVSHLLTDMEKGSTLCFSGPLGEVDKRAF
jgi:hypothetical protein